MITRRAVLIGSAALAGVSAIAGCTASSGGDFDFESITFAAGEPQNHETYEEAPNRTYRVGDTVWVVVEVANVPTDDSDTARLEYVFETETPDGDTWEPVHEREESWDDVGESEILIVWDGFQTYEDDPDGEYEMTITVEDQVDGERLQTTEEFTLEGGG